MWRQTTSHATTTCRYVLTLPGIPAAMLYCVLYCQLYMPACFLHPHPLFITCAVSFARPAPDNCAHPAAALPPRVCCCFPQNPRCLVGSKDRQSSCVAIAALVRALERSGRVAILRWVQRDNMVSLGVGWGGVGWKVLSWHRQAVALHSCRCLGHDRGRRREAEGNSPALSHRPAHSPRSPASRSCVAALCPVPCAPSTAEARHVCGNPCGGHSHLPAPPAAQPAALL